MSVKLVTWLLEKWRVCNKGVPLLKSLDTKVRNSVCSGDRYMFLTTESVSNLKN